MSPSAARRQDPIGPESGATGLHIALRLPVIVLVLAGTIVPADLRAPTASVVRAAQQFDPHALDVLLNIAGYVPIGVVFAGSGVVRALVAAVSLSGLAEFAQLFMSHRFSSVMDLVANAAGAAIGVMLSTRWHVVAPRLSLTRQTAAVAAVGAFLCLNAWVWLGWQEAGRRNAPDVPTLNVAAASRVNARGATSPGTLEAHWTFDQTVGNVTPDASPNRVHGRLAHRPAFVDGVIGRAIQLDGATNYVRVGVPLALELVGDMTIAAWINPSTFPDDDAAIVSSHSGLGYQLDTTVDRGPRTMGFKLSDTAGRPMARYGRTSLLTGTWYHVAGVYDSRRRTMDVYLNGRRDNGCLLGTVTDTQSVSGFDIYLGRRPDAAGYEFAGLLDDVRIYSLALTPDEIVDLVRPVMPTVSADHLGEAPPDRAEIACSAPPDPNDPQMLGSAVVFGLLAATAFAGFQPARTWRRWGCIAISGAAGLLLLPSAVFALPSYDLWMVPLLSAVGGIAVAASLRRSQTPAEG